MHPLVWLVWRDSRSAARGWWQRWRTPRGVLATIGLFFFAGMIVLTSRGGPGVGGNLYVYGPSALMVLVVLGAFSPVGLYFRPPDVDWLFTAPLTRRDLVLYNIAERARVAVFSGLLLSLLPAWRGPSWVASFTGYTLVFLLLQISAQWIAVGRSWLGERVPVWLVRAGLTLIFLGPVVAAALELRASPDLQFRAFFLESKVLGFVTAPTQPFLGVIGASGGLDWLGHMVVAVGILAALVTHIVVLDVPYREAAVTQSERRQRRLSRMRSGGVFDTGPSTQRRVPMFPQLAGVGPVAWRQTQELARNPRGILLVLSVVALATSASLGIPWLRGGDPSLIVPLAFSGMFLATALPLLMGDNLACDFRRDFDRMDLLKSWPVPPLALAVGQLIPAVALATTIQAAGVLALVSLTGVLSFSWALVWLAVLPVVSWIALCIDNWVFLWLPYRTVPDDPGDVGFVGRTLGTAMVKFLGLALVLGAVLASGQLALVATQSPWAAIGVPIVSAGFACAAGAVAVAHAFTRFDVTRLR
ncbi:MAG: putative ABC exporter domain-containing protein [Myxococcota bacterium]